MDMVMTNGFGFSELSKNEMMIVNGGVNGDAVGVIVFGAVIGALTAAAVVAVAPIAATTGIGYGIGCFLATCGGISTGSISAGVSML